MLLERERLEARDGGLDFRLTVAAAVAQRR
jgi:hypothetical protein